MKYLSLLFVLLLPILSNAQKVSGGVRIGLNMNTFAGPSETDIDGNVLESFDNNTGFLVGGLLNVAITDLFGVRAEVQFSQKGGRRLYEGESYSLFNPDSENEVLVVGTRNSVIRVNNSYIDIPIMLYVRPVKKLRIFGGVSFGFLVSSTGFGQLDINGRSAGGLEPVSFTTTLDHNYLKDEGYLDTQIGESIQFNGDGSVVQIPTEAGAYVLDFETKKVNTYNNFDFGVIGGLSYKLNGSLFIAAMYNLGLTDVTADANEVARADEIVNNERNFTADIDKNRSLQISLGFQF